MNTHPQLDDSCAACGYGPGDCCCPTLDIFADADAAWKDRLAA